MFSAVRNFVPEDKHAPTAASTLSLSLSLWQWALKQCDSTAVFQDCAGASTGSVRTCAARSYAALWTVERCMGYFQALSSGGNPALLLLLWMSSTREFLRNGCMTISLTFSFSFLLSTSFSRERDPPIQLDPEGEAERERVDHVLALYNRMFNTNFLSENLRWAGDAHARHRNPKTSKRPFCHLVNEEIWCAQGGRTDSGRMKASGRRYRWVSEPTSLCCLRSSRSTFSLPSTSSPNLALAVSASLMTSSFLAG
jgi:hypothetical protein